MVGKGRRRRRRSHPAPAVAVMQGSDTVSSIDAIGAERPPNSDDESRLFFELAMSDNPKAPQSAMLRNLSRAPGASSYGF